MSLSKTDMLQYVYDPTKVQQTILEYIDQASDNTLAISDPTNPFSMLLESTAVLSASASAEGRAIIRKKYPKLALSATDLVHHLSDAELTNMFAVPSETNIVFYINVLDLRNKGYRKSGTDYVETIIPKYTEVVILNTTFTLLNDISIKLYDTGGVFVEQFANGSDIAVNDLGILSNAITNDTTQISWIIFETRMRQVKRNIYSESIIRGEGFSYNASITNDYFYSNVTYKNAYTNNTEAKLVKSHNEEYVDPTTPSVFISINGKEILYRVPDVYIVDGNVSGVITIETYETEGYLYLPINKYTLQDFKINFGDSTGSNAASTVTSISILANSSSIVEGGSNSITLEALRSSIINNATGAIDTPITFDAINRLTNFNSFDIFKAADIITDRLFIATKNTPELTSKLILARQDIFFNTTTVELGLLTANSQVYIDEVNDIFIIKSGTVFKEENNIVTILTDNELALIKLMTNNDIIQYFNTKQYFYTPYYYIIDKTDSAIKTRVYDMDRPMISNLKISGKNPNVAPSCNVDKFTVVKLTDCYRIYLTVVSDDNFKNLDISMFGAQLTIPLFGGTTYVSIPGVYDVLTEYMTFDISTNLYINKDNYLEITNGVSNIYTKLINITTDATIYLYTLDSSLVDSTNYLTSDITVTNSSALTVLSKENITLKLGTQLNYLWNRMYNAYTERKYQTYTHDMPLYYDTDVFELDPVTGTAISCDNAGNIAYNITHHKGAPVLDANGDQVYKYKKGDIILDDNMLPKIDTTGGVIRYIDICMLEYEYKLANSTPHINYLATTLDLMDNWLVADLPLLNDKMIENTEILLKSYKTARDVNVKLNSIVKSMKYVVHPKIVIYTTKASFTATEIDDMKNTIGGILHKHLDGITISLTDIKAEIISTLGSTVVGVKVTGIDEFGDMETFIINDKTARLVVAKILELNKNNELIVKYDINLTIQTI